MALIRQVPLGRHRLFLSNVSPSLTSLISATSCTIPAAPAPSPSTILYPMIELVKSKCLQCQQNPGIREQINNGSAQSPPMDISESEHNDGPDAHILSMQLLMLRLQAYLQFTGNVYIVKRAVKFTMTGNNVKMGIKLNNSVHTNGILSSATQPNEATPGNVNIHFKNSLHKENSSNVQRKNSNDSESNGNTVNASSIRLDLENFDLFGQKYSKDELIEYYRRFAGDRKILTTLQSSVGKLSKACSHVKPLVLFMILLYLKSSE